MKEIDKKIRCVYEAGVETMLVLVSTRVEEKNYVMTCGTMAVVSARTNTTKPIAADNATRKIMQGCGKKDYRGSNGESEAKQKSHFFYEPHLG